MTGSVADRSGTTLHGLIVTVTLCAVAVISLIGIIVLNALRIPIDPVLIGIATAALGGATGILARVRTDGPTGSDAQPISVTLPDEPVQVVQVDPAPADLPVPDEPVSVGEAAGVDVSASGGSLRKARVRRQPL